MDVILCQDVPKLGKTGDVVKVKDGFARNLLIPRKLAYKATASNLKRIQILQRKKQEQFEQEKKAARGVKENLEKVSLTVSVEVNDQEKLYGSVTDVDIAKALADEGFEIDRKQIEIDKSIEELGIFEVGIKLHSDVTAKVRLWVTKK